MKTYDKFIIVIKKGSEKMNKKVRKIVAWMMVIAMAASVIVGLLAYIM